MVKNILKLVLAYLLLTSVSYAQVKIVSYNLLGYPGNDTATRNPYFRTVINSLDPDILVVQEMTSQAGINAYLNNVMNVGRNDFEAGTFINGPDTDNGIYFRNNIFIFLSNTPIKTALRDINEFKLVHIITKDTLRIYSVHLKASSGSANELLRAAEVDSLRKVTDALHPGSNFIVCGDFNIYGSNELAYQKLMQITSVTDGNFNDPLNLTGTWNNPAYAIYHTQSPRVRSFGGGATGGMDDRFDMMLYSNAVKNPGGITYVANSLVAYGNDGNHFNDSINRMPNTAVSQEIANALHYTSDHLPVYSLFTFEATTSIANATDVINDYSLNQNYPNPWNPVTKISFQIPRSSFVTIKVFSILGKEMQTLISKEMNQGYYEINLNGSSLPGGVYFYRMTTEDFSDTKRMILIK
ncbi:MAG: T9SS type A sorting domain-containing protein [Ignavibacteria bacterium]